MNKTTDSFKRLQAVIKDGNGDNRGTDFYLGNDF